jgi:CDP-diacylglycerol---serine O-phosphatidyltransferase
MINIKRHIPNTITLLNLLSGAVGVVASLSGFWYLAFWLMILAAVFDFFDGMAARLLNVSSPLGKELDSLADLISFGFLPATMVYRMMFSSPDLIYGPFDNFLPLLPFVAFLIAAFSALRLAKFNIDTRQTEYFIGMPTPANALFIGGFSLVFHFICHCNVLGHFVSSIYTLLGLVVFSSIMPITNLPMLSLKFKSLNFKKNIWRYLLIFGSVIIGLIFFKWIYMSVSLIILYYLILSVIWGFTLKNTLTK